MGTYNYFYKSVQNLKSSLPSIRNICRLLTSQDIKEKVLESKFKGFANLQFKCIKVLSWIYIKDDSTWIIYRYAIKSSIHSINKIRKQIRRNNLKCVYAMCRECKKPILIFQYRDRRYCEIYGNEILNAVQFKPKARM